MAIPRIFVSSTCYDLYEVRNNLREFISSFYYEPVMSEYGDIFYDYSKNVQDSCIDEINNCQMYILIIGNNFGSIYYKSEKEENPSSVTEEEFKQAMESTIPKHIFINKFVKYDYDNYRIFLDAKIKEYFGNNKINDEEVDQVRKKIRDKIDSEYPFVHQSYRHLFKFIEIIMETRMNGVFPFETSTDIQNCLKKQWAGFLYDRLEYIKNKDVDKHQENKIDKLTSKLEKVLLDQKLNQHSQEEINLEKIRNEIDQTLDNMLLYENDYSGEIEIRGFFKKPITYEIVKEWVESLSEFVQKYKWTKLIEFNIVFSIFDAEEYKSNEIKFQDINNFNKICLNFDQNEMDNFINTIVVKFKKYEKIIAHNEWDECLPFT